MIEPFSPSWSFSQCFIERSNRLSSVSTSDNDFIVSILRPQLQETMTRGSLGIKINAKVSFRVSDGTLQAETQHFKGGNNQFKLINKTSSTNKDIEGHNPDVIFIYIQICEGSVACVISLIRSWKESSVSKLMADQSIIWWIWMNDLASERTTNKRLIYQETQKSHNIAIKTNCLNSWSRIRVHGRCKRWICMRHAWWTGSWL